MLGFDRELTNEESCLLSDCLGTALDLGGEDDVLRMLRKAHNSERAEKVEQELDELSHTLRDALTDAESNLYDISAFGIYFTIGVTDNRWEDYVNTEGYELPDIDALTKTFRKHLHLRETTSVVLVNKLLHPYFFEPVTTVQWRKSLKSVQGFFQNLGQTIILPNNHVIPSSSTWEKDSLFIFVRAIVGFIVYEDIDEYDRTFFADNYGSLFESIESVLKSDLEKIAPVEFVLIMNEIVPAHSIKDRIQYLSEELSANLAVTKGTLKVHPFYTFKNWYERFKDSLEGEPIETVSEHFRSFLKRWHNSVQSDIDSDKDIRITYADTPAMKASIRENTGEASLSEIDESLWREAEQVMDEITEPLIEQLSAHNVLDETEINSDHQATIAFYGLGQGDESLAYIIATIHKADGRTLNAFALWNTFDDPDECIDALLSEVEEYGVTSIVTIEGLLDIEICEHCMNVTGRVADRAMPASARSKVGRNELCPCGSGKKYKRCCGT